VFKRSRWVNNSKGCQLLSFLQTLTLQEAFETAAQINEELKRTEFDGAFAKKIQAPNLQIFFIFPLDVENR